MKAEVSGIAVPAYRYIGRSILATADQIVPTLHEAAGSISTRTKVTATTVQPQAKQTVVTSRRSRKAATASASGATFASRTVIQGRDCPHRLLSLSDT